VIERMFPNAMKLEMFARSPRLSWDTWGNEGQSICRRMTMSSSASQQRCPQRASYSSKRKCTRLLSSSVDWSRRLRGTAYQRQYLMTNVVPSS
jgi:hypothetical protein